MHTCQALFSILIENEIWSILGTGEGSKPHSFGTSYWPDLNSKNKGMSWIQIRPVHHLTVTFFWLVTPCVFVGRYQQFRGTCCLPIQGTGVNSVLSWRWRLCVYLKCQYPSTKIRVVTYQKIVIPCLLPWEPQISNITIISIVMLPVLQILCNVYIAAASSSTRCWLTFGSGCSSSCARCSVFYASSFLNFIYCNSCFLQCWY